MKRRLALILSFGLLTVACSEEKRPANDGETAFSGYWESEPVRFVRGDIDETYYFYLDAGEAWMDILYHSTDSREDQRRLRQSLSVSTDTESGMLVLAGDDPTLVEGPAFIGEYAPDILYCEQEKDVSGALQCLWGSDAHGEAPAVILRPERN